MTRSGGSAAVPVECFYEWRREEEVRQPYTIGRADGQPCAGGLWDGWRDPATDTVRRTFTIVTSAPNEAMASLHNRMPVILAEADWDAWLDPRFKELFRPGDARAATNRSWRSGP